MVKTTDKTANKSEVAVRKSGEKIERTGDTGYLHPFEEMDHMFENLMARGWLRPMQWDIPLLEQFQAPFKGKVPRVDVIDRKKELVIRVEIPGVKKRDIDISMTDTAVTIKAATSQEQEEEKEDYYRSEITKGSFSRSLALPDNVDSSKAKATFTDGVLELTVPKLKESKHHNIKLD